MNCRVTVWRAHFQCCDEVCNAKFSPVEEIITQHMISLEQSLLQVSMQLATSSFEG